MEYCKVTKFMCWYIWLLCLITPIYRWCWPGGIWNYNLVNVPMLSDRQDLGHLTEIAGPLKRSSRWALPKSTLLVLTHMCALSGLLFSFVVPLVSQNSHPDWLNRVYPYKTFKVEPSVKMCLKNSFSDVLTWPQKKHIIFEWVYNLYKTLQILPIKLSVFHLFSGVYWHHISYFVFCCVKKKMDLQPGYIILTGASCSVGFNSI